MRDNIIKCRTCVRKRTYIDILQAEKIICYRKKSFAQELRAYKCPYCGYFHITHKEEKAYNGN